VTDARWRWLLADPDYDEIHELAAAVRAEERLAALYPSVTMGRVLRLRLSEDPDRREILLDRHDNGDIEVRATWAEPRRLTHSIAEAVEAAVSLLT